MLFSIKTVIQLAVFYNSYENCCLTSSDYSSDTFKSKVVNSIFFRESLSDFVGIGLWGRNSLTEMNSKAAQTGEQMINKIVVLLAYKDIWFAWTGTQRKAFEKSSKPER